MSDHSTRPEHIALETRVGKLEYWQSGNGTPHGAESRIARIEELVRALEQLQLPEKFPSARKLLFDLRDTVDDLKRAVETQREVAVSAEQLEQFMTRVINKIDSKMDAQAKGKNAQVKAYAPYFVALCSTVASILVVVLK